MDGKIRGGNQPWVEASVETPVETPVEIMTHAHARDES